MSKEDVKLFEEVVGKNGYAVKVPLRTAMARNSAGSSASWRRAGKEMKVVGLLD